MENNIRVPRVSITTSISNECWMLAKENNIAWNDALEFGIKFLVADKEEIDYPDCSLQKKLEKIIAHRNSLLSEIELLRTPIDKEKVTEEINKELKEVFGGL